MNHLLLQCRSGFEKETAAEITDQCAAIGVYGYCTLTAGQGYLLFNVQQPGDAERAIREIVFSQLIFIRQWMVCGECHSLEREDRVSQVQALIEDFPQCADVWIEYPDTTDGRELATFAKKFSSALAQKLRKSGCLKKQKPNKALRLMLFTLTGSDIYIGYVAVANSAPWPLGIPRLKFPKNAPSRSTLKLEESWHWFIPKNEWDERLPHGSTAVDLGAAPGGWTWQLVQRSMFVTAVDNGPMQDELMESGQVKHALEDAYKFMPEQSVNLMVCDVVDKPIKTAEMAADWVIQGWCNEAIFNLKLPMKQRYTEVIGCFNRIAEKFMEAGLAYELSAKHLYHDREEITCLLRII